MFVFHDKPPEAPNLVDIVAVHYCGCSWTEWPLSQDMDGDLKGR
jgi:hypothetical protein